MTQKDKLKEATMMAMQVKSLAGQLRYDAKDYDVQWPRPYADRLEQLANHFLNLK